MATTMASTHQAVTSSTAAHVMASAPILVLWRPVSVRMRASTGKAVMAIAAPMKRANPVKVPLPTIGKTNRADATPNTSGMTIE